MRLNTSSRGIAVKHGFLDTTGAAVSWVCIFHCLLAPVVLAAVPLWGFSFLTDEKTEWIIISTSALIAVASFIPAFFFRHGKFRVLVLSILGIGTIAFSSFFLEDALTLKAPFLITGAILMTSAHLLNRRLCKDCECPDYCDSATR